MSTNDETKNDAKPALSIVYSVESVAQLMCLAHILALVMKWSVQKHEVLEAAISTCQNYKLF